MTYFRLFAGLLVLVAVIWFVAQNSDERVTVKLTGSHMYSDIPLVLALLTAFIIGMFAWFVISLFQDLRVRHELRQIKRENARLLDELKALRNLPVRDIDDSGDVLETEEQISG